MIEIGENAICLVEVEAIGEHIQFRFRIILPLKSNIVNASNVPHCTSVDRFIFGQKCYTENECDFSKQTLIRNDVTSVRMKFVHLSTERFIVDGQNAFTF